MLKKRGARTKRVAVSFDEPPATGRWLRGLHFSAFSLLMMGVILLAVVILAPSLQSVLAQRQEIADQQKAVTQLSTQVDALEEQRARWSDPSYIRAQARDRLYYVMPGEVSYLIIDDRAPEAKADSTPVSSTLQKTKTDWVGSLFGSFMGAGLTDASAAELEGATPSTVPTAEPGTPVSE